MKTNVSSKLTKNIARKGAAADTKVVPVDLSALEATPSKVNGQLAADMTWPRRLQEAIRKAERKVMAALRTHKRVRIEVQGAKTHTRQVFQEICRGVFAGERRVSYG